MKHYQGYLVDLDGTMYKGEAAVDGASHFIDHLIGLQVPFLFLTNNSSRTQDQIAAKLNKLGVKARPDQVYTSSLATADFIKEKKEQARVYVIGEEGLHKALTDRGHTLVEEGADFVVIGIDREISYTKLARACLEVRKGAGFVSTNSDTAIPTDKGMLPGNGALTSVIAVSTGVDPTFVGKPEPIIMERALKELQLQADHVLMVGDNYHTDILAGMKAGVDTLMVETGLSSFHEIEAHTHQPTYKKLNLHEWLNGHKG
ncbi:TIGR01457 family HAD-type hydrolase [Halobacillus kuroshimensis]|uniref:TIGR01457 family HAD-type hydrolase n=1 Tax=Halobacillus kuroshimensis TaxID=302481 RepID=UPI0004094DDC|nr:TIGR01457 family HAD-type hydrolase [Halobacillus kuroshimensis]